MDLITTHLNSDFDSLGAMIAAKKLYPDAVCVFPGSKEKTLRQFFINSSSYATGFARVRDVELDKVTRLIVVDVDNAERIGVFAALVDKPGVEVHVYDHHPTNEDSIKAGVRHVERVGAVTTMMVEILREKGIEIDHEEATVMLLGIFEDTGGLTFVTTTTRDFEVAGYLLGCGADLTAVREFITPELTADQVALLDDLLKSRKVQLFGDVEISICHASFDEYVGDLAVLAHKICDIENLDTLILYVRMEDRVHIVARSRVVEVDVSEVARHFGGGGHPAAASATVREMTPIQVAEELMLILPSIVKPMVTAADILTSTVKVVTSDMTLSQVRDLLNRYHINAVPVLRGEKLVGLITRIIVERALQHGLEETPAEQYMTTEFETVTPQTPLERVRELIVEARQRFVPVVEDSHLLGAVTRTDLLRALSPGDKGSLPASAPKEAQVRRVVRMFEEMVDDVVIARLRELGQLAVEMGMTAYLVGGMVRDILLRKENLDVDVVVEGDGIELAMAVGKKWGAAVHPHRTFGTAKIVLPDGFQLDIATARTEYYKSPAALPTVEQSSLKLDLSRRDFTVNTLAMRLEPERFGEVIDFFGGFRDLKEKTLRILHNLSFVEDPTRILRALRFSLRFGFSIGSQTSKLIKNAVKNGFLAQGRGIRMFRETRYLFEEADPLRALALLKHYKILEAFHPAHRHDSKLEERLEEVIEVNAWYELLYTDKQVKHWMTYLLAILDGLDDEEVEQWIADFGVAAKEGNALKVARGEAGLVLAGLRMSPDGNGLPNSVIYRACSQASTEALLYAMARTRHEGKRRAISRYCTRLAGVSTFIRGKDLMELGIPSGPIYRLLLGELLDVKLDGKVATRKDEERWVKRRWNKLTAS